MLLCFGNEEIAGMLNMVPCNSLPSFSVALLCFPHLLLLFSCFVFAVSSSLHWEVAASRCNFSPPVLHRWFVLVAFLVSAF